MNSPASSNGSNHDSSQTPPPPLYPIDAQHFYALLESGPSGETSPSDLTSSSDGDDGGNSVDTESDATGITASEHEVDVVLQSERRDEEERTSDAAPVLADHSPRAETSDSWDDMFCDARSEAATSREGSSDESGDSMESETEGARSSSESADSPGHESVAAQDSMSVCSSAASDVDIEDRHTLDHERETSLFGEDPDPSDAPIPLPAAESRALEIRTVRAASHSPSPPLTGLLVRTRTATPQPQGGPDAVASGRSVHKLFIPPDSDFELLIQFGSWNSTENSSSDSRAAPMSAPITTTLTVYSRDTPQLITTAPADDAESGTSVSPSFTSPRDASPHDAQDGADNMPLHPSPRSRIVSPAHSPDALSESIPQDDVQTWDSCLFTNSPADLSPDDPLMPNSSATSAGRDLSHVHGGEYSLNDHYCLNAQVPSENQGFDDHIDQPNVVSSGLACDFGDFTQPSQPAHPSDVGMMGYDYLPPHPEAGLSLYDSAYSLWSSAMDVNTQDTLLDNNTQPDILAPPHDPVSYELQVAGDDTTAGDHNNNLCEAVRFSDGNELPVSAWSELAGAVQCQAEEGGVSGVANTARGAYEPGDNVAQPASVSFELSQELSRFSEQLHAVLSAELQRIDLFAAELAKLRASVADREKSLRMITSEYSV